MLYCVLCPDATSLTVDQRQCQFMFPEAFPKPPKVDIKGTNKAYKGWDVRIKNIFFANGMRKLDLGLVHFYSLTILSPGDPWRDATISAEGLNVKSTPQQPIGLGDGFHCSDLSTASGLADPTILAVQKAALTSMKMWLADWKPGVSSDSARAPAPKSDQNTIPQGRTGAAPIKPISAWNKGAGVA